MLSDALKLTSLIIDWLLVTLFIEVTLDQWLSVGVHPGRGQLDLLWVSSNVSSLHVCLSGGRRWTPSDGRVLW